MTPNLQYPPITKDITLPSISTTYKYNNNIIIFLLNIPTLENINKSNSWTCPVLLQKAHSLFHNVEQVYDEGWT